MTLQWLKWQPKQSSLARSMDSLGIHSGCVTWAEPPVQGQGRAVSGREAMWAHTVPRQL